MSHVKEGVSKGKSQVFSLSGWRGMVVSSAEVGSPEDKLWRGEEGGRRMAGGRENAFLHSFIHPSIHSFIEQLFAKPFLGNGDLIVDKVS